MSKKDIIKKYKGRWTSDKWLNRYLYKRTTKTKHRPNYNTEDDNSNNYKERKGI